MKDRYHYWKPEHDRLCIANFVKCMNEIQQELVAEKNPTKPDDDEKPHYTTMPSIITVTGSYKITYRRYKRKKKAKIKRTHRGRKQETRRE
ncbi:hypothetical protein I7I50_00811 [Histoplasma capsulatum G186AR]|uniref:Uncharacterized protein n=1 Tax=Ajellomyces capsulatus TaxID=5037 RepID=A0A8H8CV68_AJECA|nr:hypothetical protein I7I52_08079 [Histoplasma capsulatum]QSS72841.1 hypothetical protein I7I50_00811 [Histoplasma capsulatum G186AR]